MSAKNGVQKMPKRGLKPGKTEIVSRPQPADSKVSHSRASKSHATMDPPKHPVQTHGQLNPYQLKITGGGPPVMTGLRHRNG